MYSVAQLAASSSPVKTKIKLPILKATWKIYCCIGSFMVEKLCLIMELDKNG